MRDGRTDDEDTLCCCEYLSEIRGDRRHLLQCCCQCDLLDETCDRWLRCQSVPNSRRYKLVNDVMDRIRVPAPGGAIRLTVRHIIPFVVFPFMLFIGTHGPWYAGITFVLTLQGFGGYTQYTFMNKRKNVVVNCMLCAYVVYTYSLYLLYLYPVHFLTQTQIAIQHTLIVLFLIFYALTLSGPGFVPITKAGSTVNYISRKDVHVSDQRESESVIRVDKSGAITEVDAQQELIDLNVVESSIIPPDANFVTPDEKVTVKPQDFVIPSAYWPMVNSDWCFCTLCKITVPPQTGHCRTCGRCVYHLDHHCFWLDTCIGLKNIRWFVGLMTIMVFGNMYNGLLVMGKICPDQASWVCAGIFQQSIGDRYLFLATLYGMLIGVYMFQPLIRALITASTNVTIVRFNRCFKHNCAPSTEDDEKLPASWLTRNSKGFFRNWATVLCPPNLWDIPVAPPPNAETV